MHKSQPTILRDLINAIKSLHFDGNSNIDAFRELVSVIDEKDLAHCLVKAFCMGSLPAVLTLYDMRAPFPINFKEEGSVRLLNDMPLSIGNDQFMAIRSPQELNQLLELAPMLGLGFLTGADGRHSLLFDRSFLSKGVTPPKDFYFQGNLPIIQDETVFNPELLNEIINKRDNSAYPLAYDRILCLVKEEELDGLGDDFVRMSSFQEVSLRLSKCQIVDGFKKVDITRYSLDGSDDDKAKAEEAVELLKELEMSSAENESEPYYKGLAIIAKYSLVGHYDPIDKIKEYDLVSIPKNHLATLTQVSPDMCKGFDIPKGYVVCAIEVDRLERLKQGPVSESNLKAASEFMIGYDALGSIAFSYNVSGGMDYSMVDWNIGKNLSNSYLITELGKDPRIRESLLSRIPIEIWENVFKQSETFSKDLYVTAHKEFGFDNEGATHRIRSTDLISMRSSGVTLHPDTIVISKGISYSSPELKGKTVIYVEDLNSSDGLREIVCKALIDMGVWPAEAVKKDNDLLVPKKPETVEKLIAAASRFKLLDSSSSHKASLRILLKEAGAEECARHAKSDKQWNALLQVFGDELGSHMENAPKSVKRDVLMQGLGV